MFDLLLTELTCERSRYNLTASILTLVLKSTKKPNLIYLIAAILDKTYTL